MKFLILKTFVDYIKNFGFFTLTGGIFYSMGILTLNPTDFRIHIMVLLVILILAEIALLSYMYLKQKFFNDRMKDIVKSMKVA